MLLAHRDTGSARGLAQAAATPFILATPTRRDKNIALVVFIGSLAFFACFIPFVQSPLAPAPAFIALYQGALVINDLITAALLFGHYRVSRLRALLVLACGYLFAASIAGIHLLTFPGLFAEQGLLGAGPQTTAWLYMIWHAAFPLFVVGYAVCGQATLPRTWAPVALGGVLVLVSALTGLTTAGASFLPSIMRHHGYASGYHTVAIVVWLCSLLALVSVWRKRPRTVLDLWLLVVMFSWLAHIALAAVLNSGRFDVGFYAGRIYGLLASSFVLMVLLIETVWLQARFPAMAADVAAAKRRATLAETANFLLELNEKLRMVRDPSDIQYEATRAVALQFAAYRVGFAEALGGGDALEIAKDYVDGAPVHERIYRCGDYGPTLRSELQAGRTVTQDSAVTQPVPPHPMATAEREPYGYASAHVPLVRHGSLAAVMFVHHTRPHEWSSDEIALLTAVAERTWAAVERVRTREAQAAAAEQYERQVRLFDCVASTTPDFVYVLDVQGRFRFANRQLLHVWGMALEDVIGKTCLELGCTKSHHDMHTREIARVMETKRPVKGDVPFEAPRTGVSGVYEYIFAPVLRADGQVELIAATSRDVTERKEAERRKDNFIATLSHELRAPVTTMCHALDLIRPHDVSAEARRTAYNIIDRTVSELVRLVDDLFEIARVTSGTFALRKVPVELNSIIESAVEAARPLVHRAGHKLHASMPEDRLIVLADPVRLGQVFANLLNNAAKYTQPGGAIAVHLRRDASSAVISVTDTGEGIAPDELPRLFQMFMRGQPTTRGNRAGLGIGLAVVRSLIEMHGGTVGAQSEVPAGEAALPCNSRSRSSQPRLQSRSRHEQEELTAR